MLPQIGKTLLLAWHTLTHTNQLWRRRQKIYQQLHEIGNASLLMTAILSLFIGGVLALQSGPLLAQQNLTPLLGQLIGLSMTKELAPVMISILIAGRIGSAIAAEIGAMQIYQEIDALKTMHIHPIPYLILPRIVAILIALPILVTISILIGWTGGALIATLNPQINLPIHTYLTNLQNAVNTADLLNSLTKTLTFALTIGLTSCQHGLDTQGGPRDIGQSATKAVVHSIILILILDYILTRLLLHIQQ